MWSMEPMIQGTDAADAPEKRSLPARQAFARRIDCSPAPLHAPAPAEPADEAPSGRGSGAHRAPGEGA
jgi:hypothetical protein